MNEVLVFRDYDGYSLTLKIKSEKELNEIKRRLSDLFTFRTPNR